MLESTVPATSPPAEPTVAAATVAVLRSPGFIQPDVVVTSPRPLPDEPLPPPRLRGNRSLIQTVIDNSGPVGRRLVILAGVLVAVLLGLLAARIDDRTQIVQRIQARRHVDEL